MNAFEQSRKPSKRVQAAARAGRIRRQRLAQARERETRIAETVVDVLAARLAIDEAQQVIADGVAQLKMLGETQVSIAELCGMRAHDVRTALALARTVQNSAAMPKAETGTKLDV